MPRGSTDETDFITWLSTWGFIFVGSERFLFNTMAWSLTGFSIILFVLNHSMAILLCGSGLCVGCGGCFCIDFNNAFYWPFPGSVCVCVCVCVCVWVGGGIVGGCRLYPELRARCAHASPSALLYPNGKLQWHFTCGFNFRHSEGVKGCFKDTMKAYFCYVHTLLETLSRLLKITITILKLQMCSYNGCSLI